MLAPLEVSTPFGKLEASISGLLLALRAYYRKTRPPGSFLFRGQRDCRRPLTRESINWGLALAVAESA